MSSEETYQTPDDLSLSSLRAATGLPSISAFSSTKISAGQASTVYRIHLQYGDDSTAEAGPSSVILKSFTTKSESPHSGISDSLQEREFSFYQEIGLELLRTLTIALPKCYEASFNPENGSCSLLLQDVGAQAIKGNDIEGATIDQARLAMAELGRLHSLYLRKSAEGDLLHDQTKSLLLSESPMDGALFAQLFSHFKSRYGHIVLPEYMGVCSRLVTSFDEFVEKSKTSCMHGLTHGDYRLDNMLFAARTVTEGRPESTAELAMTIVGWQHAMWGPLLADVAYFLGCALQIEDRGAWTEELLQSYCDAVGEQDGDPLMPLDRATSDLRIQSFFGVKECIVRSMILQQTEANDEMYMVMLERHCQMVLDLDALDVLSPSIP